MNIGLQIAIIVISAAAWFLLVWHAKPRRDVCRQPTNEDRLLSYIDRRAAWECEQRKRKLLQRQRVERLLEQRWLARNDSRGCGNRGPTVPRARMSEFA